MSQYTLHQVLQAVAAHQYERALLLLLSLLPLKSLPPSDKRFALALACFQLGLFCERSPAGFEKAEKLYLQARELAPSSLPITLALGALFARQGKKEAAEAILVELAQNAPNTVSFWLFKGNLAQLTRDFESAQSAYQEVLRLEPDHAGAWNNVGWLHCQKGSWQEAYRCFQRAVELLPDFAEAWCNLGLAYLNLAQSESAYSALLRALQLQPQRTETLTTLGIWAQAQKKFEQAEHYLSAAFAQDPNQTLAAIQLTWLYCRQDRWEEAQNLLSTLLENPLLVLASRTELAYTQAQLLDLLQARSAAKACYQVSFTLRSPNRLRQLQAALPGPSDRFFESQEALGAWHANFQAAVRQFEPGSLCLDDYFEELMQHPLETGWGLLYQGEWPLALKADYTRLFSVPSFDLPARRPGSRLRLGYITSMYWL